MSLNISTRITLLSVACTSAAMAQSRQIPAAPTKDPVLLIGGTIHPVTSEPLEDGWIAFEDGRITLVGRGDRPIIDGATVIDL